MPRAGRAQPWAIQEGDPRNQKADRWVSVKWERPQAPARPHLQEVGGALRAGPLLPPGLVPLPHAPRAVHSEAAEPSLGCAGVGGLLRPESRARGPGQGAQGRMG